MTERFTDQKGFLLNKHNAQRAQTAAAGCPDFREDSEDECIGDAPVSCYNCRYRRWLPIGYHCMKGRTQ